MQAKSISRRDLLFGSSEKDNRLCQEPLRASSATARHVVVATDVCLARQGVACQSCGGSCPYNAIRFRPRLGGPFLPDFSEDLCTGCDACLQVCPVGAIATKPFGVEILDA